MTSILLTLQFVLTVLLVIAVLMQKSASMGFGVYSGSNESLFGAKGASGFLAKTTAILGIAFVINTLALGYSYQKTATKSVVDSIDTKTIEIPASTVPTVPATTAPAAPTTNK
ncbi:MAG: preprotein translocase subunit SecG [Campylobacteraceae bacterium]|nr:preprotein translocase subunit SecG [Campylobacteraceae bacterium]